MRYPAYDPSKPGVGPLPVIRVYECGNCGGVEKTLSELLSHYDRCVRGETAPKMITFRDIHPIIIIGGGGGGSSPLI